MCNKALFALALSVLMVSCAKDRMSDTVEMDQQLESLIKQASPTGDLEYYILPDENDLQSIPQDQRNLLTPERVELGKNLFFDTGFGMAARHESGMGTFACGTCHIPEAGFKPGNFQGVADGGIGFGINGEDRRRHPDYLESDLDVQSARPLTMVNVAFVKNTFWNGQFGARGVNVGTEDVWHLDPAAARNELGFEAIETQNFDGLEVHRYDINEELIDEYGYRDLFDSAYPDLEEELRYSNFGGSLAISAYIRTILATKAPFQDYLKGNMDALSAEEKQGAILFFSKANCSNCHYQQNLGSLEFHALGVLDMDQVPSFNAFPDDKRNLGRGGFTQLEEDYYKFKVPGLYNVKDTPFYFHGSSAHSLEEVIEYKDKAVSENPRVSNDRLSEKFLPLNLTELEKSQLVAFLEKSLTDPDLGRYGVSSLLSGNCFPNNDQQSRRDLGCE